MTAWMKALSQRSQDVYQQIADSRDSSLERLVEDVGADGQVCLADHTICLSDTGESAEWQKNENWIKKRLTCTVNSARDLQYTLI